MSVWLPPYLGSWQELLNALLHDPFLGSGKGGYIPKLAADLINPGPSPWDRPSSNKFVFNPPGPGPDPWGPPYHRVIGAIGPGPHPWTQAVSFLISAVSLKQAAAGLSDDGAKAAFESGIDDAISRFLDDYCGTRPPGYWPWPGPPPWIYSLSADLVTAANSFPDGILKSTLSSLAIDVLSKVASPVAAQAN
jgi:hypothetical protein